MDLGKYISHSVLDARVDLVFLVQCLKIGVELVSESFVAGFFLQQEVEVILGVVFAGRARRRHNMANMVSNFMDRQQIVAPFQLKEF